MYYQNGNYMQDLNYYNQNPSVGYNPYMQNNFQNMNTGIQMGQMHNQNLNAMYPAVYRIISPVANQVLANNNIGYLTEDALNKMVDTIYNIVESDINLSNNSNVTTSENNENSSSSNCTRTASNTNSNSSANSSSRTNSQNSLLRDLIKIIVLNEIISRRHNSQGMFMQNQNINQPMFM